MSERDERTQRLAAALRELRWGANALADATGMRTDSAVRLIQGRRWVADWLLTWLEDLAAYHRAHPVPPPPAAEPDER
jgi:hypothetical protein